MALDLVLKNFETTYKQYNSDQLWTSSIIIIDEFYIYSLTYASDRNGLYVNDYKTDIEHSFGDSLFRFKNKIYIIHPSDTAVSGSVYNFQTTEPYLVKEKDLNPVNIGTSFDFTRKHQYGQDTFIFASGYANSKVYVFFIENEEIKYITIDVEEYTGTATEDWFQPNIIYVEEKYLKNQNITESGIYYLIKEGTYSSDSAIYSGIRDDSGQFKTIWRKCETNFTSISSYVYKQDDTIFLLQFDPSPNETHIGYYSIERRNDDYTIYFNNILEVNKENEMWIFSLSYCENPIGKQNFDFYTDAIYADISASTVHNYIAKLSLEVTERQPFSINLIDENNDFTLYEVDPNTETVGEKNPDVFKNITISAINMVAVMKYGDYYLFGLAPTNPQAVTDIYYGAIKYNNPCITISSITIDGQDYPYDAGQGQLVIENLSIRNTTDIYIHTPALKPVAIINPNGEKTYARIWTD